MGSVIADEELLERFTSNTLPAFPHEEHLHVVFERSATADVDATIAFMRDGIRNMAAANGNPGAYHDTRTAAWVRLLHAARTGFEGDFGAFLVAHPEFIRRDLLSDYYSSELLTGAAAREAFVEPDLRELP
ncbi:hypothetical protein BH11ACT3_BH11ACT3_04180 [soil metagenome]